MHKEKKGAIVADHIFMYMKRSIAYIQPRSAKRFKRSTAYGYLRLRLNLLFSNNMLVRLKTNDYDCDRSINLCYGSFIQAAVL